jgi:hypothetical protein
MKFLSKTDILSAIDHTIQIVEVPEWGGAVHVRSMTGRERDWWELTMHNAREEGNLVLENLRATFAAMIICDDEGKSLFTKEDIAALAEKSGVALDRVLTEGMSVSGISKEVQDDLPDFSETDQNNSDGLD